MAQRAKSDNELLARLDERTLQFARTLDFIAAENRELANKMITALDKHADDDNARFDKHDTRIKLLENWRWYILGALAIFGGAIVIYFQIHPMQ